MTRRTAKTIALAIVERWTRIVTWLVKFPVGPNSIECRWFKSEERAKAYAAPLANAIIVRDVHRADDHPELADA